MGKRLLYKPIAHATAAGEVAVYVGGSYANLTLDEARVMRDQVAAAIDELEHPPLKGTNAIRRREPFAEQLDQFRSRVTDAGAALLDESRAMDEIGKEAQS
jgi:hypothetical protein